MKKIRLYKQLESTDCGPACLLMILRSLRIDVSFPEVKSRFYTHKDGVSLFNISKVAENFGCKAVALKGTLEEITKDELLPVILHWKGNHFVVLHKISKDKIFIADPGKGYRTFNKEEFTRQWINNKDFDSGVFLYVQKDNSPQINVIDKDTKGLKSAGILSYVFSHKRLLVNIFLALIISNILQLIFPLISQSIVDTGISNSDTNFIILCIVGQAILLLSNLSVDFIKDWQMHYLNNNVNIRIVVDFLAKLMRLPVTFYESRKIGDIMQRMNDHSRIQGFLTGSVISSFFSVINIFLYSFILYFYMPLIFAIFLSGTLLYIAWIFIFLRPKEKLDHLLFEASSQESSGLVQLISGMREIKLNNIERKKRWQWEKIQANSMTLGFKSKRLSQLQRGGVIVLCEARNMSITLIVAKAVITGNLTLGNMLAIQYIVGILSRPIDNIISFIQQWQMAKISLARLNEVHQMEDEEKNENASDIVPRIKKEIKLENISFKYPGGKDEVLKDINLTIPAGRVTAIVGTSGSGKTTLLKLLLKFYDQTNGEIFVDSKKISSIGHSTWRKECGVVMQDSFIFADSVIDNICLRDEPLDIDRYYAATKIANIHDFIEELPLGKQTMIGNGGMGLSSGQRQRLLIARAIYNDPQLLILDEATNSLDANNEKSIVTNLNEFIKDRTVIVVAHRLSTIRDADQIVVMKDGRIVETGKHAELLDNRSHYYTLVKNQLDNSVINVL